MLKKLILGLFVSAVVASIYYCLRVELPVVKALPISLQIVDDTGSNVAGAEVGHWHGHGEWKELGVSDAYGHWQGMVKAGTLLAISKSSSQGRYYAMHEVQREKDMVHLQLTAGLHNLYPYRTDFAYEIISPRLRPLLTKMSIKAGLVISALSRRKVRVHKEGRYWLVVATDIPDARKLYRFKVQTGYPLTVLAEKILLGIFQHTAKLYHSYYDERRAAWLVYNPAGFWRLRAGMRLTNAKGSNYTVVATAGSMVLEVIADIDVCRGYECKLYANHARQTYY